MIKFLKKYYLLIALILMLIGGTLDFYSKQLKPKQTSYFNYDENGEKVETCYFILTNEHQIVKIISNVCYTIAISIFVSILVLKRIEEEEKKAFEKRILDIQKGVNKDVLESVFERFIDKEIFDLLRKDIFNRESIRKNAKWSFEIIDNGNSYESRLIVAHEVHNNTNNEIDEIIKIELQTIDKKSRIEYLKLEDDSKAIIVEENFLDYEINGNFQSYEKEIRIKPNGYITQTLIAKQIYLGYEVFDLLWVVAPTIGVEIEFIIPDNCILNSRGTFSSQLVTRFNTTNKIRYHIIPAILPGQGIQFILNKEEKITEPNQVGRR